MKDLLSLNPAIYLASRLGLVVLVGGTVVIQAVPQAAFAQTDRDRDEFPDGRQGGGTHVVQPTWCSQLAI